MLKASCHCGQIRIEIDKRPDFLNACNCSYCGKAGARWGYFDPSDVRVEGNSTTYCRADKAEPGAQFHFCPTCGTATHFTLTPVAVARYGDRLIGVNMRLADERDLAGVELRYPDGRAWRGEGEVTYVREARILGQPKSGEECGECGDIIPIGNH